MTYYLLIVHCHLWRINLRDVGVAVPYILRLIIRLPGKVKINKVALIVMNDS